MREGGRFARLAAHVAAAAVVLAYLWPGLRDGPMPRDEAVYRHVARSIASWLTELLTEPSAALTQPAVDRAFNIIPEHPPFAQFVAAVPHLLFGTWPDPLVVMRLGNAILAVALVFAVFHFVRRHWGGAAGLYAAMSVLLIPPVYGHAATIAMDFPITVMGFLTTVAFVRGIESPRWSVACGVFFGVALSAKLNSFFLPVPLVLWGMLYHRRRIAGNLAAMALVAPVVLWVVWPLLWFDTVERFGAYLTFHAGHAQFPVVYFGSQYGSDALPPWHYPTFFLLVSLPAVLLLGFLSSLAFGVVDFVKRRPPDPMLVLLWLSAAVPVAVCSLPGVPKYDGPRLFLIAFPFVACLAGIALARGGDWMVSLLGEQSRSVVTPLWGGLLLVSVLPSLWQIHPFQSFSYYNLLVGGPSRAFAMGHSAMHWGGADRSTVEYLDRNLLDGDSLYRRTGVVASLREFASMGLIGAHVEWVDPPDWVVLEFNRGYQQWPDWEPFYRDRHPHYQLVHGVYRDGLLLIGVFRVRAKAQALSGFRPTVRPRSRRRALR